MTATLWPEVLGYLARRDDLPLELVEQAMSTILAGEATDAQIAAFGFGLRAKGETPAELATLARTMHAFGDHVDLADLGDAPVDTCGTGGDRSGTVNVSTMAALVTAAAGVPVAKHGGRAASSQCGSTDVLEALGVVVDLGPDGVGRCVREAGIGFCFAGRYHPAWRFVVPVRRELGVPTTFNFLGPLANPAGVRRQVVGVADPAMAPRMIGALSELGTERALVFYGHDGLDELTVTTTSTVHELRDGDVRAYDVDPTDFGIGLADHGALAGGDAAGNAEVVHKVLGRSERADPRHRDAQRGRGVARRGPRRRPRARAWSWRPRSSTTGAPPPPSTRSSA